MSINIENDPDKDFDNLLSKKLKQQLQINVRTISDLNMPL